MHHVSSLAGLEGVFPELHSRLISLKSGCESDYCRPKKSSDEQMTRSDYLGNNRNEECHRPDRTRPLQPTIHTSLWLFPPSVGRLSQLYLDLGSPNILGESNAKSLLLQPLDHKTVFVWESTTNRHLILKSTSKRRKRD